MGIQENRIYQETDDVNKIEQRNRLFALIRQLSFSTGTVKLSSGQESNFYFNMKYTMLHPEAVDLLANLFADRLEDIEPDYVGGLELGAIPLIPTLVSALWQRNRAIPGFLVRKRAKEHGTKQVLEGVDSLEGKKVVILDDVTTSGKSAMQAVDVARDAGAEVVLVLAIVDRCEGAVAFYREQGIPFASLFSAQEFK